MKDCVKLILKIVAIVLAAAAVASAVTLVILKLVNKSKEGCCECVEEPCCEEVPAVEEVPEEYADFADVQTAE